MGFLTGVKSFAEWRVTNAKDLADFSEPDVPGLIVHYDFLRAYRKHAKSYAGDKTFDILEAARKVSIVTLWAPPERLERQLYQSEISGSRLKKKHGEIIDIYSDAAQLLTYYDAWLAFCRSSDKIGTHVIVEHDTAAKILSLDNWRKSIVSRHCSESAVTR
ncbi:MAG TPA: hypothetical protein VGH16_19210 [Candidatus Binatia bacterium]|jgi:hypothetical protein